MSNYPRIFVVTMPKQPAQIPLILASTSPRRFDLMSEAGYIFEVRTTPVEEIHDENVSLLELTAENAQLKASAVAKLFPHSLVLGADTLVSIDGLALTKPVDMQDARNILGRLTGRTHQVCTAVYLTHLASGRARNFLITTEVTFRPLTPAQIDEYLELINPMDKAGAYAAQEHGDFIIEKIEGSWTNVVGLPMEQLALELAMWDA